VISFKFAGSTKITFMIGQDFSLYEMFMQDTRETILLNARLLGLRIGSKEKKAVMAARFAKTILSNPLYLLKRLPFQDVLKLQKMVHAREHTIVEHQGITLSMLEVIGLIDTAFRDNLNLAFIYSDLANALKPVINTYVDSIDPHSGKVRHEQIVTGLINLYGILPVADVAEFCMQADPILTPEMLKQTINGSYYISRCLGNPIRPVSFVSHYVFDPELVIGKMEARKSIAYTAFTTGQILAAGDPDFPLPPESETTRSFRAVYRKLRLGSKLKGADAEAEINRKISMTWILLNNDMNPTELIQHLIEDADLDLNRINELMSQVVDMGNNMPRWILKGNSSRSVFEKYEKEQFLKKPPKVIMGPGAIKAGIDIPQQEFNRIWEEKVAKPSPKTGRNDPCPCGSGRKYKHCCLSNLN
jgi:hypothetical protein